MSNAPSGTVTFIFTDIEGSTLLWQQYPEQVRAAMSRHDEIIEALVGRHDGMLVRPCGEGDSRFAVFSRATDAVAAAAALQEAFHTEARWCCSFPRCRGFLARLTAGWAITGDTPSGARAR